MNMDEVVRFVDDWMDKDPNTRDSSPGKIRGMKLIKIGVQKERRITRLFRKSVKHIIFNLEGSREIWYKNNFDYPAATAMGFSLSRLTMHPKAVSMEQYAKYFLDKIDPAWLERNDFVLESK